jgi:hypothetical protein
MFGTICDWLETNPGWIDFKAVRKSWRLPVAHIWFDEPDGRHLRIGVVQLDHLGPPSGQQLHVDIERPAAPHAPLRMTADARVMVIDRSQAITSRGDAFADFKLIDKDRAAIGGCVLRCGSRHPKGEDESNGEKGIRQRADAGTDFHI